MDSGRRDWMARAACRERPDLDWFDLDCYLHACLAICAICPVAAECLEYAIKHEMRDGLWGGEWGYRLDKARRGRGRRVTDEG